MDSPAFEATPQNIADYYSACADRSAVAKNEVRIRKDLPRHKDGERFIKGPIPLEWMKLASSCGNRAEAIALLLWYLAGLRRSNPVKLSASVLSELRVHPKTAKRTLQRMAEIGLVEVEFSRGRSPIVTLVSPDHAPKMHAT